jgi:hypothetical protein
MRVILIFWCDRLFKPCQLWSLFNYVQHHLHVNWSNSNTLSVYSQLLRA